MMYNKNYVIYHEIKFFKSLKNNACTSNCDIFNRSSNPACIRYLEAAETRTVCFFVWFQEQ